MKYILALDQGTTSSRSVIFDAAGRLVASVNQAFEQHFPQPGWVEHDPYELLSSQRATITAVLEKAGLSAGDIAAVGITNQRETTLVWDRKTGEPIYNAIVWQCRRTAPLCEGLAAHGWAEPLRVKTGLVLDAYFSATKLRWILDHVPGAQKRAEEGELCFGTVDSWLIYHMTGGRVHATDYSNASRTMLFNIHTLKWDEEILGVLNIPAAMLPQVKENAGFFGMLEASWLGREIPIMGAAGDQQAALFGQGCFSPGMCKNTYGTGCFLLMNTGGKAIDSPSRLLSTVAWQLEGKTEYALEGSIFMGGASIQWLRDQMGFIENSAQSEQVALSVADTGGVYLVPAFTGLGAPYWDMYARGTLVGMTRGTGRAHIVRATLEAIAYQSRDVLEAMRRDSAMPLTVLKVDGGASANNMLMQFQSDILSLRVVRPDCIETTARGAAFLAGLACGMYESREAIAKLLKADREFMPQMSEETCESLYRGWQRALERSRDWARHDG
jgi:glycerol kinase